MSKTARLVDLFPDACAATEPGSLLYAGERNPALEAPVSAAAYPGLAGAATTTNLVWRGMSERLVGLFPDAYAATEPPSLLHEVSAKVSAAAYPGLAGAATTISLT